jgi:hypothetical protein
MKSKLLISLVILIPALVIAQAHRVDSPVVPGTPSLVTSGAKGVGVDSPDSVPVVISPIRTPTSPYCTPVCISSVSQSEAAGAQAQMGPITTTPLVISTNPSPVIFATPPQLDK